MKRNLKKTNWVRILFGFPILLVFVLVLLIILSQDVQIFPGAFFKNGDQNAPLPVSVDAFTVRTADGKDVAVWRLPAAVPRMGKLRAALVFHGNGGDIRNFYGYQRWLADVGYTTYAFDFRGFGKSAGWPSESGLEKDSDAVFAELLKREKLTPEQVVLFGISIGTAPATYLATRSEPGALVLLAPFTNIADVVRSMPYLSPLIPFLWYDFPTETRVRGLKKTCFIVVHGHDDEVIPFALGKRVANAYAGSGYSKFIDSASAHHNDIMHWESPALLTALEHCELPASQNPNP